MKSNLLRNSKDVYVGAKISSITQEVESICDASKYERVSFNEALTMLEKTSAKELLDSSLKATNDIIGKVEYFTNLYATQIYQKIFKAAKPDLKILLEKYYLKYQIHNIISTLRCIDSKVQSEVEVYLIGNQAQKDHCIKASMYSYDEALRYFSTKFKFPKDLLKYNSVDTIMLLETGLYKWYHEELQQFLKENYTNSSLQIEHQNHIDILNQKIYHLSKLENGIDYEELHIEYGKMKTSDIEKSKLSLSDLDKLQQSYKENVFLKTKSAPYGSYAMILNFMQHLELKLKELSMLLKEKALN